MAIRNDIDHETTALSHRLGLAASVVAYVAPAQLTLSEAKASGGGSGVSANAGTGGTGGGTPPAATPIIAP